MEKADVVRLINDLEAEVNNGGFDQFFYNSAGDNTAETIQALNAIGALHMAEIMRKAASKFPNGNPPRARSERQEILLQISPDADAFEELDGEFCAYPDHLADLLRKYQAASA